MRKTLLFVLALLLSVFIVGCTSGRSAVQPSKEAYNIEEPQQTDEVDRKAVESLVESFGKKLQMVSLQSPKEILEKSMQENYGDLVSQELLTEWINDPLNAPGRLTSSPWPDRIEILNVEKSSENAYEVKGEIIEITSTEKESGGIAAKRPITLVIKKSTTTGLLMMSL